MGRLFQSGGDGAVEGWGGWLRWRGCFRVEEMELLWGGGNG